jgi:DNA-binding response OmpR family regulator
MLDIKPQVAYFSDEQEMVDLVTLTLSERFDVMPVIGMTSVDEALDILRQIKPDYVIVDPSLPSLDYQELSRWMKADAELKDIQILIVKDDVS